ncbi:hypothetical protein [Streptomyces sp. NPDC003077]|uniref:hypothetical protein n=1 Tax=Streptomyces sp. NPDC003077 TaxID=3154443 RepID=UPI0033ADC99D
MPRVRTVRRITLVAALSAVTIGTSAAVDAATGSPVAADSGRPTAPAAADRAAHDAGDRPVANAADKGGRSDAVAPPDGQADGQAVAAPPPRELAADAPAPGLGVPSRTGSTESSVDRVADFYGAYVDARRDGNGKLAEALRAHYLTGDLRTRLAKWEKAHHADGVFRDKKVPTTWRVTYNDSGMGHAWHRVRLTWGDGAHARTTQLTVQSDLATLRISDIQSGVR